MGTDAAVVAAVVVLVVVAEAEQLGQQSSVPVLQLSSAELAAAASVAEPVLSPVQLQTVAPADY